MSARSRLAVAGVGAAVMAAMFIVAFLQMPHLGSDFHPYGDRAV